MERWRAARSSVEEVRAWDIGLDWGGEEEREVKAGGNKFVSNIRSTEKLRTRAPRVKRGQYLGTRLIY